MMRELFDQVDVQFFHLTSLFAMFAKRLFRLFAVPFRNTRLFPGMLKVFEAVDGVLMRIPGVREQAWFMILTLSKPKKRA